MSLEKLSDIKTEAVSLSFVYFIVFRIWNSDLERFSESLFLTLAFRILLWHGKDYKIGTHQCILQSVSWLCRIFAAPDLLSFLSPLLWPPRKLTTVTTSPKVLWFLPSVCIWPVRSPGKVWRVAEENVWGTYYLSSLLTTWWVNSGWMAIASIQQTSLTGRACLVPGAGPSFCFFRLREGKSNLATAVSSPVGFLNLALGLSINLS